MLSELDNIDKHRLLLVARPKFAEMDLSVAIDGETRVDITPSNHPLWRPLEYGAEPFRVRFIVPRDSTKPQTKVDVKAEPMIGVVFDETGLKCDGREAQPTIRDMITDVCTIVSDFEEFF